MPVIIKRPRVKIDLAEIWDYIADDSEANADAFVDSFDKKFQVLVEQPDIGRARDELEIGLRSFPLGRYIIFYRKIKAGIEIIRVLHSAQDLNTIFHVEE